MCGRFTLRARLNQLLQQYAIDEPPDFELPFRYNIAPSQEVAVVRATDAGRELTQMRWGLIPSWTKDPKKAPLLINARADTVAEKPSFRSAYKQRRCLIPADGYYEWMEVGKKKQPYHFHLKGGELFAFAGLWEKWETVESCVIITTDANEMAAKFHDRMPVILSPNDYEEWLTGPAADVGRLLDSYPASEMSATAVNPIVNNARNEVPECIEPVAAE